MVCKSPESTSPGNLLEAHILRLHPRSKEQTSGGQAQDFVLTRPEGDSDKHSGLKATGLVTTLKPHCSSTH